MLKLNLYIIALKLNDEYQRCSDWEINKKAVYTAKSALQNHLKNSSDL